MSMSDVDFQRAIIAKHEALHSLINEVHALLRQVNNRTQAIMPLQDALNHLVDAEILIAEVENMA